jgi:23S rRNA (pseudouridine1915-N3)-methyltransferase
MGDVLLMKVQVLFVGRPRDPHLNGFAEEFIKRATRYGQVEMREIDPRKYDPFARHVGAQFVLLDPTGKLCDSYAFAEMIREAELSARDLVFVIGGHDGLLPEWKAKGSLLSISRMTFPHELARAILAEQIYRGYTILRGHPYPR